MTRTFLYLFLTLLAPAPARGASTIVQNSGPNSAATTSAFSLAVSKTVAAGSNRILIAGVHLNDSAASVLGVSWSGSGFSRLTETSSVTHFVTC